MEFKEFFKAKTNMVEQCKEKLIRNHQEKILEKNKDVIQKFVREKDPHHDCSEFWIEFATEYMDITATVELTRDNLQMMYDCFNGKKPM